MLKKTIFLSLAVAALGLAHPSPARAQMMGGDEKKDDDKPADPPKADDPAKPDAGKADKPAEKPAEAKKTLVFDKIGADWKEARQGGGNRGMVKVHYRIGKKDDLAEVFGGLAPAPKKAKPNYEETLAYWCGRYQDKDGKKLETSAAKQESFDVGELKVKTFEIAGSLMQMPRKKDQGGDAKPEPKPDQKAVCAYIENAPDGPWLIRLLGSTKSVDASKDAFLAFVKSAKVGEQKAEEPKKDEPKKDDPKGGDKPDGGMPGGEEPKKD